MTIGFPGGKQNIADNRVTANTTIGHIRAIYNNLLLGNVSTHSGNSGGPVISRDGTAIGIASAVRMDNANLILFSIPIAQSDFAMILPIAPAQKALLARIKAGEPAWNGVPDPADVSKDQRTGGRRLHRKPGGCAAVGGGTGRNQRRPGAAHFLRFDTRVPEQSGCGRAAAARKAATINPGNGSVRFLHYLNDWQAGNAVTAPLP